MGCGRSHARGAPAQPRMQRLRLRRARTAVILGCELAQGMHPSVLGDRFTMRSITRLLCVLELLLSLVACNEVATPTAAPLTLMVVGKDAEDGPRVELEGARICQTGTSHCEVSDDSGVVTIQFPIGEEISWTLERAGYASYLVAYVMPDSGDQSDFEMASSRLMVARHDALLACPHYPMIGTGDILIGLDPVVLSGATFNLVDATGEAFYVDADGIWRPDLAATTSRGLGGFCEVPPGNVFEVELGGTAQNCLPGWGWPSTARNAVRFPVQENYVTWVAMDCPRLP
jgi:hypothetical protein